MSDLRSAAQLKSGLQVFSEHQSHLHTMAAAMYIRTGSRYETERTHGISHLAEHMLFRGTPAYPTRREFDLAIESVGGNANAWTSRDMVSYHIEAPAESGAAILKLLNEMFKGPRLEGLEKERQVVLEELRGDFGAVGQDLDVDDVLRRMAFGKHALGRKIVGTEKTLNAFTTKDLKDHINKYYVGNNMSLVLTGNLSEVMPWDDNTLQLPPGSMHRGRKVKTPKWNPSTIEFIRNSDSAHTVVVVGLRGPGRNHEDYMPLHVLSQVLCGGMSARLEQKIREQGLAYDADLGFEAFDDLSLLQITSATSPDKVLDLVKSIIQILKETTSVTDDELHLAKKQVVWNIEYSQDSPLCKADQIGLHINRGNPYIEGRATELVKKVTKEDVTRAASNLLKKRVLYLACLGKVSEPHKRAVLKQVKLFTES